MTPRAATTTPTPQPSVVFADNDALVLEAISELLRSKGYDVQVAHDGREALHLSDRSGRRT